MNQKLQDKIVEVLRCHGSMNYNELLFTVLDPFLESDKRLKRWEKRAIKNGWTMPWTRKQDFSVPKDFANDFSNAFHKALAAGRILLDKHFRIVLSTAPGAP